MGEVYRARDTRLDATSPSSSFPRLRSDPSAWGASRRRPARFGPEPPEHRHRSTRSARGRASRYIAMELVEGRTLRELLAAGPLPVGGCSTSRPARERARHGARGGHRAPRSEARERDGVPDGLVKILDFGLAKRCAFERRTPARPRRRAQRRGPSWGPSATCPRSRPRAERCDFRSDQFSFGSILYEMVTGRGRSSEPAAPRRCRRSSARAAADRGARTRGARARCAGSSSAASPRQPAKRYAATRDLAHDLATLRDHVSDPAGEARPLVGAPSRAAGPSACGSTSQSPCCCCWRPWPESKWLGGRAERSPGLLGRALQATDIRKRRHLDFGRFSPDGQSDRLRGAVGGQARRALRGAHRQPGSRPLGLFEAQILSISSVQPDGASDQDRLTFADFSAPHRTRRARCGPAVRDSGRGCRSPVARRGSFSEECLRPTGAPDGQVVRRRPLRRRQ